MNALIVYFNYVDDNWFISIPSYQPRDALLMDQRQDKGREVTVLSFLLNDGSGIVYFIKNPGILKTNGINVTLF